MVQEYAQKYYLPANPCLPSRSVEEREPAMAR
jgi:hypothetical protein